MLPAPGAWRWLDSNGRVSSTNVSGGSADLVEIRQRLARVLGTLEFSSTLEADAAAGVALQLSAQLAEDAQRGSQATEP